MREMLLEFRVSFVCYGGEGHRAEKNSKGVPPKDP